MVYNDFASRRGSMDLYCALSGIEQAMWDVAGKKLGVPVYKLLGGACRDKIRVYANGWYSGATTPEQHAEKALATVERGFTAMKFDPFPGPWRLYIDKKDEQRAADIINPDVCSCGGILELKEIAAMAEPNYVAVSPHNYNSTTLGLAATIQVSACIPNFLITEYFVNFEETGNEVAVNPFRVENGYIELPAAPGLGIELKEEELLKRPYRQYSPRSLRHYHQEGP